MEKKEYTVIWMIQTDGVNAREAAEAALRIMMDPGEARFFEVYEGVVDPLAECPMKSTQVDLNDGEDDGD